MLFVTFLEILDSLCYFTVDKFRPPENWRKVKLMLHIPKRVFRGNTVVQSAKSMFNRKLDFVCLVNKGYFI